MTATPLWFGPHERPLFGWVHVPEGGRATGAAVLCPPLARELNSTQGAYRCLAERLAAAGMLAIRFDYDGTGDSAGSDRDRGRVASWLESIGHATDLARTCGSPSVSLVGMRMGAWLAAAAAPGLEGLDAIVLWDPCTSGRSFIREQVALLRMATDESDSELGGTALPGFVFSSETVAELGSLAPPGGGQSAARVLLLTRPGRPQVARLAEPLGPEVTTGDALGQEQLLEVDPLSRQVPDDTVEHIVSWLSSGAAGQTASVSAPITGAAQLECEGSLLSERVVRLGTSGLFGIATEPECETRTPTVLMLNAGTDSHIGPSRLWVELSRRWASAGLRCVRFDMSGLGDSPVRPRRELNVVRAPEAFDDVADARCAVEPDDPGNVILVGLCSGGYQALEGALQSPVRAVYAINPVLHFTPPELASGPMDPRRRICWPTKGLSQAYRSILMEPVRRRLRKLAWSAAHLVNRDRDRDPTRWLDELRRSAVEVFVVCGDDQAHAFKPSTARAVSRSSEHDPIQIDVVSDLDGALLPAFQRADVIDRLTEHVVTHFAPEKRFERRERTSA